MIKINKYLILFSFFLILNCSFGDKAGIWTGSEDIKRQTSEIEANQKKNNKVFKIYTNLDTYKTEKTADYKVKLSDPKKSLFWKRSLL